MPTKSAPARPRPGPAPERLDLADVIAWLVTDGMLAAATVEAIATLAGRGAYKDKHPLVMLAERNLRDARNNQPLTLEALTQWLAARTNMEFLRIDPVRVEVVKVTAVCSYAYAERHGILPVEVKNDVVTVAVSDPFSREWERELGSVARKGFKRVLASAADIKRMQVEFWSIAKSVTFAADQPGAQATGRQTLDQLIELGRSGKLDANDQGVVTIVDWLLSYAFEQRASDIHLEPKRDISVIRFRIDGVLHEVYQLPTNVMVPITSRLKILARMDIAERRRPQDGRLKSRAPNGSEVELRLSTMPTAFGEKLVMRIFDPAVLVRTFAELGFDADDEAAWRKMVEEPHGIILVTGPTGSGKTTTLYSTLKQLTTPEVNVCTIEDPIELIDPSLNQMQVHPAIGLDFASGVRTLLRQDPDVIMVGEIRDPETAEVAVQAALTGHLVLSTLHTNDAPSSITRLIDLAVQPFLLQSSLLGVIAQRLARTLCPACKQPGTIDEAAWSALIAPFQLKDKAKRPAQVMRAVGCLDCRGTGYRGRVGLYEMLTFTPELRAHIKRDADHSALARAAIAAGMKPLRLRGAQKVAAGLTTAEEILRVVPQGTA
jgi:general secretion pathway protein E